MYDSRFTDPLGYGSGLSRFSDPTGRAFGVIYLGSTAKVTFVETILRDRGDGRGRDCVIAWDEIESRILASIVPLEPMVVVDLTGDGPLRMGVPSDVVGARDQSSARAWSAAFYGHSTAPDGVLYPSRLNEERCLAIYDRAVRKLEVAAAPRLPDCRSELAAILDDLEIAIR